MGIAPVVYTFYAILATVIAVKANVSLSLQLCTPFLVICALPFMNYAALKFGEAGVDVFKYSNSDCGPVNLLKHSLDLFDLLLLPLFLDSNETLTT
jgi:hypothetical protein